MYVNIISDTNRRIPRKKIMELLALIEEDEDPPESTVNIIFTQDRQLARLNRQYRSKPGPTDVLSFNIDNEPGKDSIFGEIYISTDTAARNAVSDGIRLNKMLLQLCCHGFLHLLGYDHEKEKDRIEMTKKENYYLGKVR